MQAFNIHQGIVAPLDRPNVDTDAILPKQFLKSISRAGFGPHLFDDWRYLDTGRLGQLPQERQPDPSFMLNQARYANATVLLARNNFGCGSSREHAPWALVQYGFRALIAPSFADIFYNNCFKNSLLPIVLGEEEVSRIFKAVEATPGYALRIDLPRQVVIEPDGNELPFELQAQRKYCLINGFDDIGLTLRHVEKIRSFEREHLSAMPWVALDRLAPSPS